MAALIALSLSAAPTIAFGQAGSAGGKVDKSVSGGEDAAPSPPAATPPRKKDNPPRAVTTGDAPRRVGCFKDRPGRDLNGSRSDSSAMTPASCIALCKSQGFAYAATQYGRQCFCGNSYGQYGAADNCNMPCSGNPSELCGGFYANSVYKISGRTGEH